MAAMDDGRPTEHAQFPKVGRPRKPQHERRNKQKEATKWRDARRVYLGNSFDRWKKVKDRLGLKDCSLAWHLLEAHDSHCVECGKGAELGGDEGDNTPRNFYPQLIKSIRRICLQYLTFQHTVEVVGLICLEIDKGAKENHSIKELINRPIGLRYEALTSQHRKSDYDHDIDDGNEDDSDDDDDLEDEDDDLDGDETMSDASVDEHSELGKSFSDPNNVAEPSMALDPNMQCEQSNGDNPTESKESALTYHQDPVYDTSKFQPNCDIRTSQTNLNRDECVEGDNSSQNVMNLTSMQNTWSDFDSVTSAVSMPNDLSATSAVSMPNDFSATSAVSMPNDLTAARSDDKLADSLPDSPVDMAMVKSEDRFEVPSDPNDDPVAEGQVISKDSCESDHRLNPQVPTLAPLPVPIISPVDLQTSPIDLKVVKAEPTEQLQVCPDNTARLQSKQIQPIRTYDNSLIRQPESETINATITFNQFEPMSSVKTDSCEPITDSVTYNCSNREKCLESEANQNTKRKTTIDMNIFIEHLKSENEMRSAELIPAEELDSYLCHFLTVLRKKNGEKYEPTSLRAFVSSIDRYLRSKGYPYTIVRDLPFRKCQETLKKKMKELKTLSKAKVRTDSDTGISDSQFEDLYKRGTLGVDNPYALVNTLWCMCSMFFGIKTGSELHDMKWGDIQLCEDEVGEEYLLYTQQKRQENENQMQIRLYSSPTLLDRDPVFVYKTFRNRRPKCMLTEDSPFFLSVARLLRDPLEPWFKTTVMGINSIYAVMKKVKSRIMPNSVHSGPTFSEKNQTVSSSAGPVQVTGLYKNVNTRNSPVKPSIQRVQHGSLSTNAPPSITQPFQPDWINRPGVQCANRPQTILQSLFTGETTPHDTCTVKQELVNHPSESHDKGIKRPLEF